jgi:hypothetical protein
MTSKALNQAFNKFGVFGFADVIAKKQKALRRKYISMSIQYLKMFFRPPKVVLTIIITLGLYKMMIEYDLKSVFLSFRIICLCLAMLIFFRKITLQIMKKSTEFKWMFEEYLNKLDLSFFIFLNISNILGLGFPVFLERISKTEVILSLAFLASIFLIITYFEMFVFPRKVQDYLSQNFPEYVRPNNIL